MRRKKAVGITRRDTTHNHTGCSGKERRVHATRRLRTALPPPPHAETTVPYSLRICMVNHEDLQDRIM